MALTLTQADLTDLMEQAENKGETIYQLLEYGVQSNLPIQFGQAGERVMQLRQGLEIAVLHGRLNQPLRVIRQHETTFPLVAKFYLSGTSRVQTLDATDIDCDYQELAGHHYLYHLPNHTEIEEWFASQALKVVIISIDPDYFNGLDHGHSALPKPIQSLLAGDRTHRFHQPLGRITDSIQQQIQKIFHCPYTGLMQQLYLESKVLELLTLQLSTWQYNSRQTTNLDIDEIEQLHWAKETLVQQAQQPPSLTEFAQQVGLSEHRLNQGFRHLFGTTVFGYLKQYRLQQAQALLHNPNLSIAKVAATVGYRNPEAFSTAFRQQFAISPKAYQLGRRP
ncbi:helix-turn-helix transcriptional regulator [Acaryochloris marina]|uniref:Transcriptional regulator, AraC family n=1 Tax=Acaryochloris marina (strain MBIC 11017) TaxID=329726 RepID=A8ZKK3_ACAM1|nr:AraC family transcriptional regulator [Acaryochloris marina]ABW31703.1 transcriptional regulator, AraC family [Acaryochloris marina MBIC11017]